MKKSTIKHKPKTNLWGNHVSFKWDNGKLSFCMRVDGNWYFGWALEGSLNEIAEKTKHGMLSMSYALVTLAQVKRWVKTKKPPKGYPV